MARKIIKDTSLSVGSAVLADRKLQNQLSNRRMVIRRKSTFRVALSLLALLAIYFIASVFFYSLLIMFELDEYEIYLNIIIMIFTLGGIYRYLWRDGKQDSTFVWFNNLPRERWRGLLVGLFVSIPWIISSVILLFAKAQNSQSLFFVFKYISSPFMLIVNFIVPTGFISDIGFLRIIALCLIPGMIIVAAGLGYFFGFRKIRIFHISKQLEIVSKRSI